MLLRDIDSIDIDSIFEPPLFRRDLNIIPAHLPLSHPAILCKRPVFEAIATLPLHSIMFVLVLVPELDCDLVVRESEQFLAQAVLNRHQHYPTGLLQKASPIRCFLLPLRSQELDNGFGAGQKAATVPPDGVSRVRFSDGGWVSWIVWSGLGNMRNIIMCKVSLGVPEILRLLHLRPCSLFCVWWCQRHGCYLGVRSMDRKVQMINVDRPSTYQYIAFAYGQESTFRKL
jgi:hypothetical protein